MAVKAINDHGLVGYIPDTTRIPVEQLLLLVPEMLLPANLSARLHVLSTPSVHQTVWTHECALALSISPQP